MERRRFVGPLERVYAQTRLSDKMLADAYQNLLRTVGPIEVAKHSQGRQKPDGRSRKRKRPLATTGGQA